MKKLLVFQDGLVQDRHQLEDYLYDSEVVRSNFIDMNPEDDNTYRLPGFIVNVTTWDVVFKGDDKYDYWHVLVVNDNTYDFEEPKHAAAIELLAQYKTEHINLTVVTHSSGHYVLVYRVRKAFSELISAHLPKILESFDGKTFGFRIPEDDLGSAALSVPKEEAD